MAVAGMNLGKRFGKQGFSAGAKRNAHLALAFASAKQQIEYA
jgi:hypothetical protein